MTVKHEAYRVSSTGLLALPIKCVSTNCCHPYSQESKRCSRIGYSVAAFAFAVTISISIAITITIAIAVRAALITSMTAHGVDRLR